MSRVLLYPHLQETIRRLPKHFRDRWLKYQNTLPVNYMQCNPPLLGRTQSSCYYFPGEHCDVPPKCIYPPESQKCLWNGEAIVIGYAQKNERSPIYPKAWTPKLSQHVFYSDILDRWMIIVVSDSALHAIEKAGDLDTYILSTPEEKMQSRLGMHLKREMLLRLTDPSFCSDDQHKRALLNKHQKHIIPVSSDGYCVGYSSYAL
ncbi:39S ribosomal protein L28 mitochondrial [Paragonimus heterotremus]|uniref:Large ribosomal subunit protein bL28m n=1 Tax=Paragonimus heterotremus TaxID=100268 RepID=A0A8J4SUB0_9TREM|nr:39S ribosomal protein L28 mitochondrial [Paragonimus heterotremus]